MTKTSLFALSLTLVAACGDDNTPNTDAPPTDVPPVTPPRAIVVSGSFTPGSTGVMSALDLDTMTVTPRVAPNSAVGSDPVLRAFGNELFVVNRADGNNVTVLDANTFAVVEQLATGASSNPQDVAQVGDKLYVPAMGTAGVVVLQRGSSTSFTIDLSSLDPDGKPDCVSAFAVGTDVYVACGTLDETFTARGPGKVVVIDTATNMPRATVTMLTANPFGLLERMPEANGGALVIGTVPSFADPTMGCVEKITVGATPAAGGCVVQNQALTSNASRIAFQEVGGMTLMWMVIAKFGPNGAAGELRAHDLGTNTLWDGSVTPAGQAVGDIAPCSNGKLVVADQTMATNGLRVYEITVEKTTAPLPIGLAPNSSHGLICN